MTLSRLHIRFPTCFVVPLGLDVNLCVGTLWVSILLGFLDIGEYLWLCDFDILFGTWDYVLSAVGVGHLGPMQSGGSGFFSLTIWDPFEDTMAGPLLIGIYLHFIHVLVWGMVTLVMYVPLLWWMSFFYDDWMYHVLWMVLFTLLH